MKAQLVNELPSGPEWLYEVKLDGYRAEVIKDGNKVRLLSSRGNDFTGLAVLWLIPKTRKRVSRLVLPGFAGLASFLVALWNMELLLRWDVMVFTKNR